MGIGASKPREVDGSDELVLLLRRTSKRRAFTSSTSLSKEIQEEDHPVKGFAIVH